MPKTEDLLATLNGGQKFTKLDLSQAYQQLLLDEQSSDYLTINIEYYKISGKNSFEHKQN